MGREPGLGLGAARLAAPGLRPVLDDEGADGWDFKELLPLGLRRRRRGESGTTRAALLGRVGEDFVGARLGQAGRAAVTELAADFLARALAQTSGAAHRGRVRRGWQGGVMRVLVNEGAEF